MKVKYNKGRKRFQGSLVLLLLFSLLPLKITYAEPAKATAYETAAEEDTGSGKNHIYTISQNGDGDFTSIQAGVDAAISGDTLYIYPGVYEESVRVSDKTINLIGIDRDNCIIKYDSSIYDYAPLNFSSGKVENLTVYGFGEDMQEEEPQIPLKVLPETEEEEAQWTTKFPGYALHIDDNSSYGKNIYIKNCKFISNNNFCVGVGTKGESSITFEQCEFVAYGTGGCIYFHNAAVEFLGGSSYFTLSNCVLKNYRSPYVIAAYSFGEYNTVYLTFQNTIVKTIAYESLQLYKATNMNNMFDVDTLEALEKQDKLYVNGYTSSLTSEIVKHISKDEKHNFVEKLKQWEAETEEGPKLPDGIMYLMNENKGRENIEKEMLAKLQGVKRYVIDIYNSNRLQGDGWCGLDNMYLTSDSYGNTLVEMNYPIEKQ